MFRSRKFWLWLAAIVSSAIVVGGAVQLILTATTPHTSGVEVRPWSMWFSEDRGAAALVRQDVLATAAGPAWVDISVVGARVIDVSMVLMIGGVLTVLSVGLLRGLPFSRLLSSSLGIASIVLVLGSVMSQTLRSIAHSALVEQLATTHAGLSVDVPVFELNYDLLPIAGGLVLALLATAFSRAAQLQEDTSGLV